MNTQFHSIRRRYVKHTAVSISISLLFVFASSCASVNRLREAQDAFNQAATAENTLRFDSTRPIDGSASDSPATWSIARSSYASALLSLDKLDTADENKLRADGLWGTALSLKALTQWRLGLFSKALATAQEAQKNAGDQIYPRDRAVLAALPGLIKIDQAYDKILKIAPLADVEALLTGESGAVANIQRSRELADKQHPVQIYLVQAQLAAYRNFMVAQDRLNNHATVPAGHPARSKANAQLKELNLLMKGENSGAPGQELVIYWARLCALDVP